MKAGRPVLSRREAEVANLDHAAVDEDVGRSVAVDDALEVRHALDALPEERLERVVAARVHRVDQGHCSIPSE